MEYMKLRTDKSIKNISVSLGLYFVQLIFSFVNRTIFIRYLGTEYLGVNGLFSNILTFLTLAESGIGNAMAYALYKPLKEEDTERIKSIMHLYDQLYWVVGSAVLVLGFLFTPFLGYLIKDMPEDMPLLNVYYLLYVLNTGISYFYSYRRTILICDQKLYISNIVRTFSFTMLAILQASTLFLTHSFLLYLVSMIVMTIVENLLVSHMATKYYPYLNDKNIAKLDNETKNGIKKNVGAIFIQKIGNALIDSTDNLILSHFVGIIVVGIYSNYIMVVNIATRIMDTLFFSIAASIGNLLTEQKSNHSKLVFDRILFACTGLHGFVATGMFCMLNPFIQNWLGDEYKISNAVVFIVCINFYLRGARRPINLYKEAGGIFWKDRYRTLIEAITNLIVSILLTLKYSLLGTLLGTTVSMLAFSFWYEAYLVYKNVFGSNFKDYIKQQSIYAAITLLVGIVIFIVNRLIPCNSWTWLVLKGIVCCVVLSILYILIYIRNDNAHFYIDIAKNKLRKWRMH